MNSICVGNAESNYYEYFNNVLRKDHEKLLFQHVRILSTNCTVQGRTHYYDKKFNEMADPRIVGKFVKLEESNSDDDIVVISKNHKDEVQKAKNKKAIVFVGGTEYDMMMTYFSHLNFHKRIFAIGNEQGNIDDFYNKEVEFIPFANPKIADMKMFESMSIGPTCDVLKKPDIAAVGTKVMSAFNGIKHVGEAKRQMDTGTSMETPAVGGAATLIYDYFQQGKFKGMKRSPIAATVKSILVASCMPIKKRGYNQDLMWEGHGEVNLYNFLNVDNDPKRRMALGEAVGIRDGQHLISKVNVKKNSSLRIGLS